MASPSEKLAASLEVLKIFQDKGKIALKNSELTRIHRERLLKNGFIQEVYSGWYIISSPDATLKAIKSFWLYKAGLGPTKTISPLMMLIRLGNS